MKKLSKYQSEALKQMISHKHFCLFFSMRMRKTIICIRYLKITSFFPVLIVVPFSAMYEWKEQLHDDHLFNINVISENRNKKIRKQMLQKDAGIYLMNHEAYRSVPEIGKMFFKCMIFDEIHILSNPKSAISKFYNHNFRSVEHRIGLTGTWLSKSEFDIFQIIHFLDHSYTFPYKNYWQCRFALCTQERFDWVLKPQGKKYFGNLLIDHCSVKDYLDVGIKDTLNEVFRFVKLDNQVRKQYRDLLKTFILEDEKVQKSTIFATVNYIWIRQLLSGFVEDRLLNRAKINELNYLLNTEFKFQKVVIWGFFDNEIYEVSKLLKCSFVNGKIKKSDAIQNIKSFQEGNQKRIVINCRRTEGMKLSSADAEIYLTIPESPIKRSQSKRRIFDIDQKQIKTCIYLITENTIEEGILKSIKYNTNCKQEILNYINRVKL